MRNELKTLALAALLGGSLVAVTGCAKDGAKKATEGEKPAATEGETPAATEGEKAGDAKKADGDAAKKDGDEKTADGAAKEGDEKK